MTRELKQYESSIKRKHSFNWTPKYEEQFRTSLSQSAFTHLAGQTCESLDWDVVFGDDHSVEAKRRNSWKRWTEKITVSYSHGIVTVKSQSLGNEMWDAGRNSKRVRLFIYAFQQAEKELDKEELKALEKEIEKAENWDDYQIPESLPKPEQRQNPQFWILVTVGIPLSLLIGLLLAFLSIKLTYFFGLYEVGVAILISFALKHLIKAANYKKYDPLHYLMIGMVILVYVSNQLFQYPLFLIENDIHAFGFIEFMKLRFQAGLTIKSMNTGWIGLVISWVVQLGLTYFIALARLGSNLTAFQLERVPTEVFQFAMYHFAKEKTEEEVREELSKMGWSDPIDQDEVFESIGAFQEAIELSRA